MGFLLFVRNVYLRVLREFLKKYSHLRTWPENALLSVSSIDNLTSTDIIFTSLFVRIEKVTKKSARRQLNLNVKQSIRAESNVTGNHPQSWQKRIPPDQKGTLFHGWKDLTRTTRPNMCIACAGVAAGSFRWRYICIIGKDLQKYSRKSIKYIQLFRW